jgi:hypothetical protein
MDEENLDFCLLTVLLSVFRWSFGSWLISIFDEIREGLQVRSSITFPLCSCFNFQC